MRDCEAGLRVESYLHVFLSSPHTCTCRFAKDGHSIYVGIQSFFMSASLEDYTTLIIEAP